jgi:ABC-type multidrug transport system ATPase subunit
VRHATAAVDARDLAFRYGRRRPRGGFAGVSLRLEPGVVLGVLGPNGAGKSTLLEVLATRLRPTAGALQLLGAPAVPPAPALRRRIGYAPDEPSHFGQLSGWENARFFARARGLPPLEAAAACRRLLGRFGLEADAARRVREYSYGMRRKLLLCEALAGGPALVVLDEPTLGLDPPSRDALAGEVAEAARGGAAVVVATNDVAAAAALCDHTLFLHEGRPVLEGPPSGLLQDLGASAWIEAGFSATHPPRVALAGVHVVEATLDRLRVRAERGAAVLPDLCRVLLEQECLLHSVEVRAPDLRDAFNAATGSAWTPAEAGERGRA